MKKLKPSEKVRNTGISLPPKLIKLARDAAEEQGYRTLSGLVRKLLTDYLREDRSSKFNT